MNGLPKTCNECKFCDEKAWNENISTRYCTLAGRYLDTVNADFTINQSTFERADFCPLESLGITDARKELSCFDIAEGREAAMIKTDESELLDLIEEAEEREETYFIDEDEFDEEDLPDDLLDEEYDSAYDWDELDDPD